METVCHKQLIFESLFSKEVVADFAGGRITSDAGGLLLRELDQRYRIAENAARCLHDPRDGHKVKHDLLTLVRQRLFAIAQGYEDNNDAATLAKDPAFKIMAGKAPESDGDLASQPTLSRFENRVTAKDLRRLCDRLLELYLKTHPGPRKVIVLDMAAPPPPGHGTGYGSGQYLAAQALEDRGPHPRDQPPHLGAPGLGLSLPRPLGRAVAKPAGQPRLIPLPPSALLNHGG